MIDFGWRLASTVAPGHGTWERPCNNYPHHGGRVWQGLSQTDDHLQGVLGALNQGPQKPKEPPGTPKGL